VFTVPPARTVSVPESSTVIASAVAVPVTLASGASGLVRRPTVLAAHVAKAAATKTPARDNRERDWQDAALLLSLLEDPLSARQKLTKGDRRHLHVLDGLQHPGHPAWAPLPPDRRRLGQATARLLLAAPAATRQSPATRYAELRQWPLNPLLRRQVRPQSGRNRGSLSIVEPR